MALIIMIDDHEVLLSRFRYGELILGLLDTKPDLDGTALLR